MNMILCRMAVVCLTVGLGLGLSAAAYAEDAVISGVSVRVNPGKMDAYLGRVQKLQGVMNRLEGKGSIEIWQVTAGGPATGGTFIGVEYPSLVAYAESTTKNQADAEFQKLISGLDDMRTLQSTNLYRQVSGPARSGDVAAGSVLQSVSVRVKPGRLDDYLGKVEQLRKVAERLGVSNTMRVWQATAAGEATGTVVVGLIYKDLATYAAETTKMQGDAEWQKIIAGLDGIRTLVGTVLASNVDP